MLMCCQSITGLVTDRPPWREDRSVTSCPVLVRWHYS